MCGGGNTCSRVLLRCATPDAPGAIRCWTPCGKTPVLQFNFNCDKLSVSAGLTLRNFYFRLYPGATRQAEAINFFKALVHHIDRPLLIVWDRLPAHRSRFVGSSSNSPRATS